MKRCKMIAAAMLFAAAVLFHTQVAAGLLVAGERCLTVLVPSLYLYAVLAAVSTQSGLFSGSGKGSVAAAVVLSQFGGYPLGAQLVQGMYRSGSLTKAQAGKMLCVCIGCGPGFLLGTVCGGMPVGARLWMMVSVSLPNMVAALLLLRGICPETTQTQRIGGAQLLTNAVETAAGAMLRICSMVLGMAGCMAIAEGVGLFRMSARIEPEMPAFLRAMLEVSCITDWMAQGGSLPFAAALLTFGGLCVHLQIASISEGLVPWRQFWIVRLLCSAASYGLCSLGMPYLFRNVKEAALVLHGTAPASEFDVLPGACLLLMSVLVLRRSDRLSGGKLLKRSKSEISS